MKKKTSKPTPDRRLKLKEEVHEIFESQFRRKSIEYDHKDIMALIQRRTELLKCSDIYDIFEEHSNGGVSKLNKRTIDKIKKDICFVIDDIELIE
jgi:hypothetical protein